MQKVKCSQCGTEVRIAGLGAICPACGALVTAGTMPAIPVEPVASPESRVLDLLEVAPPEPPPEPLPIAQAPQWQMFQQSQANSSRGAYWVIGVLGFLVVVLVALVLALLNSKPKPVIVTVPAVTPAPAPTPAPGGSNWFVNPPSNTKPAPPPAPPAVVTPPVTTPSSPRVIPPASRPAAPARPPGPHASLGSLKPRAPVADPRAVTDEQITTAITRGTAFLLGQFAQTRLKNADAYDAETFAGLNALATYALLQCGKNMTDPRLAPQSGLVRSLLERLKEYPMRGNRATYSRSLRISALTVHTRPEDRATIQEDLQWLIRSSMNGAYSYEAPPPGRTRDHNIWDNSNSQYGALGVWAAAEAGFPVPLTYWQAIEQHWAATQLLSGGWSYHPTRTPATLSMTAAGTNMLFVARDQLAAGIANPTSFAPLSPNLVRALEWLDEGDNAIRYDADHRGYIFYGLERAALASGFRYFGTHDWYLHFARELVQTQLPDGSWASNDGIVAETSFDLLFLMRGRQPVLYSKLRFDGAWENRPREVSSLTRYGSYQLERPHTWQVADVRRNWWDWSDAPVLMITSDRAVAIDDTAVDRLRAFALNGGLIFLHTERDNDDFKASAVDLSRRLFPDLPLEPLQPGHEIFSAVVPLDQKPPLQGVTNGARLLLVYSPTDITRLWQPRPSRTQRMHADMGMNIAIYAAGRRNLRSRLDSLYVPEPTEPPQGMVPLVRLQHAGNWDPEPAGWPRTSRLLQNSTGIGINLLYNTISQLKFETAPIAHLTGTAAVTFNDPDINALRTFLNRGGVLLIDACGGSDAFTQSIQSGLLPRIAPGLAVAPLPSDHPIQLGLEPPVTALPRIQLRDNAPANDAAPRFIRVGAGAILFIPQDLSCGLVGVHTLGIRGYLPPWCQQFVHNLILWTTRHVAEDSTTQVP